MSLEIYPSNPNAKAKPFYINLDNPDEDPSTFEVVLGGKVTKFTKEAEGNIKFVRNTGSKVNYASGAPSGQSCRFHISAGKNNGKVGSHSWKDKPTPAYVTATDTCFYSSEITFIGRVGPALGTHQSFAFKMNSRPDKPDDTLRSTIEQCMPNDQKKAAYVNYNYAHAGYENVNGVVEYEHNTKIQVNKWIGVKHIFLIADDKKSTEMIMYVNPDPLNADGTINNKGWTIKSKYIAKGIPQYQNIPPVWGGDSYIRIDGYKYVDIIEYSQREVLKASVPTPEPTPQPVPVPTPDPDIPPSEGDNIVESGFNELEGTTKKYSYSTQQ